MLLCWLEVAWLTEEVLGFSKADSGHVVYSVKNEKPFL